MVGSETEHRTAETEWQKVFAKLRDLAVRCPACGSETLLDPDRADCTCMNFGQSL